MDNTNCSKDFFKSIPDYGKIVLLKFLIKNDVDLSTDCGFLKDDNNRLCKELKSMSIEQTEELLVYIKHEEESVIEKILNKYMENYFATMFEGVRHQRSFILLLSLTDPDSLKQSKFTDLEIDFLKNLGFKKLHRQRILKAHVAMDLLEKKFLVIK